ncbi:chitin disaccharide deacetylase [Enterococcus sp. LJL99]
MGKVIINSDDFGYSRGVNYGIIDTYQKGILTSTTLMPNMYGFDHAVKLAKEFPDFGVGVHLTLTCGKPLLQNLSSLIDEQGFFKKLPFYEHEFEIDLDELYQEWNAQIQKIYRAGIEPTHLDSHHHTHTFAQNQEIIVLLAKKYDLPVRGNFEKKAQVRHVDYFEPFFDDVGTPNQEEQFEESLNNYLSKLLTRLRTEKTTEIMCHAAYIDQELSRGSSFIQSRINQVNFLIHSKFATEVSHDKEIELITYRDL